jgi:hypothetical protein
LSGVAEGPGARLRQAEQDVGEVVARHRAGEGEPAARVLLRVDVERLPPEVGAEGERVAAARGVGRGDSSLQSTGINHFTFRLVPAMHAPTEAGSRVRDIQRLLRRRVSDETLRVRSQPALAAAVLGWYARLMSTLAEIQAAVDSLPVDQKQELLVFLAARLRADRSGQPEPRTFAREQLAAWIEEDERDMRRLRERS